jgi:hypothetical protein
MLELKKIFSKVKKINRMSLKVILMSIIENGQLKGSFRGFHNRDTIFEFYGGGKWRQNGYKYLYHYAYMPHAKVLQRGSSYFLKVDGMNDFVQVIRVY